ncbi:MAG: hypothetical protein IOC82_04640 [Aestuariivirga sp.]|uniref:hypothetical protein n=1 Tax=Aestuariivirga sp. TaxID=2650926 RepID=UPI0025C36CC5|nr:hypothetical protein [Aestuariivirga sp.]MCA3560300.1 hypothetical protein [Aestuariivirga sp.]
MTIGRRKFGGLLAGAATAAFGGAGPARAAGPDAAGAINGMLDALQTAGALSFTAAMSRDRCRRCLAADAKFGASVAKYGLKTLGSRASVAFQRSGSLFAVFGAGGEPDVQLSIAGGEATLFRPSLAAKTVLKLAPEKGAAFMVPGLFIPFLGLLADDPAAALFGGVDSVTPIARFQPEQTTIAAVMGGRFTGEVWVDASTGLPARILGTWFAAGGVAASAAVFLSGWSREVPAAGAVAVKPLDGAKSVELEALGL